MGFLNHLFRHNYGHGYHGKHHHYDDDYHHDNLSKIGHGYFPGIVQQGIQILKNKKVLYALIAVCCVGLLLLIALLFFLVPIVINMIDYISKNGIKGIIDTLIPIINRIWEGQGK